MFNFRLILAIIICLAAVITLIGSPTGSEDFGFRSILPPLLAILLALISREVILALVGGIWLGASFLADGNLIAGLLRTLDTHLVGALANEDHAFILLFSLTLGGMVGIIGASGGAAGIVLRIGKWAKSARSGQIAAWAMGMFIFFDDYANTLIVGNTFRPLCDKLRISREKLSFIVDSTAAPIASIALISTWIGFEVGLISDSLLPSGAISGSNQAYGIFIETIPYRFYPIFLLLLVFMVGFWNRDFGSMLTAERRCRKTGQVQSDNAKPLAGTRDTDQSKVAVTSNSWLWGVLPVVVVILATFIGLIVDGRSAIGPVASAVPLYMIISEANSFAVLMWASFSGALAAGILGCFGAGLKLSQALEAFINGIKAMTAAAVVLILAWSIGHICLEMKTADYIVDVSREALSPHMIPALTFIISGLIAFATGTSWGTLSILMPIVAPIAYSFPLEAGLSLEMSRSIMIGSIGAVLAGSTFGDHASPISDTTIMSSMASGADHIDHVRTQFPYALTAALIGLLIGYIPAGMGISPWLSLPAGAMAVVIVLRVLGKPTEEKG
ncbi:sodium:proton antiporter [candidate division LCP-89 bacterium B3_LCP]|uniref:Sodium:proton antiporter n=1 Tax=candidate division LCP-89 bacterium B3_LCP TaxID=2012998 RepID=A0A532UZB4_UNCL8|nr:MAG: sodium:proton antiporter [candidate division LCP-89 bacterium B3_LCP]